MADQLKDINVFILCGGEGKRLKKISGRVPKPMVSIGRRPFLDIVIEYLQKFGFKRFILGIGYQANFIKKYYKKHKIPGVEIIFSQENQSLGTGGAVKKAEKLINSRVFFVLNGDTLSEFDAESLLKFYKQKKAEVLILLRKVKDKQDYGAITINKKSEVTCFSEKSSRTHNGFINCGVYLFNRNIFTKLPKNVKFSLEYDFFPRMIRKGIYGYRESGFFADIGTPERYFAAKKYLLENYLQ